jgi:putative addiction module killer protein
LAAGNPGDGKPVGEGASELRINFGPGHRVDFMRRGPLLIGLLAGGAKSMQGTDTAIAKMVAAKWE